MLDPALYLQLPRWDAKFKEHLDLSKANSSSGGLVIEISDVKLLIDSTETVAADGATSVAGAFKIRGIMMTTSVNFLLSLQN